jgi:hypothetical protein
MNLGLVVPILQPRPAQYKKLVRVVTLVDAVLVIDIRPEAFEFNLRETSVIAELSKHLISVQLP